MLKLELVYLFEYYTNTSQSIIGREITQKLISVITKNITVINF